MKKSAKIALWTIGGLAAASLAGLIITGWQIGWGPFKGLFKGYGDQVAEIAEKYDANTRKGEIVFYGASNFRLWTEMENDLAPYPVQNHGFGGSTDKMLIPRIASVNASRYQNTSYRHGCISPPAACTRRGSVAKRSGISASPRG